MFTTKATRACNMIGLLVSVLATVAVVTAENACPLIDDGPILFPNENNCNTYFQCSKGSLVEKPCPDGLQFNAEVSACDWPWNVHCVQQPEELSFQTVDDVPITQPPPTCPEPGTEVNATVLTNPYNCSTYWFCESGVPLLKDCPPGLHFNQRIGVCDFPFAANCKEISAVVAADLDVSDFENEVNADLEEEFLSATGAPPICPPIGSEGNVTVFRNPYNCSNYWYCDNGQAKLRDCPPGLQFNEKNAVCDYPWAFQCIEEPLPESMILEIDALLLEINNLDFGNIEGSLLITEAPPICPGPGQESNATLIANPYNCSTYWLCESGVPKLRSCPPGLHFNYRIEVCDFPFAANCKEISPVMTTDLRMPVEENDVVADLGEEFLSATGTPPICPPIGSEGNVTVFRNPYNCSNYWFCDNGNAKLRDCSPGLQFNEINGVCDYPWAFQCIEEPLPEAFDVQEEALLFNQNLVLDIEEFIFATGEPPICPPPGSGGNVTNFRNPYNCSNYWYCDNGFPHIRDCPPGLQFNEKNGVCDYPWAFKCIEEPLPETSTSTVTAFEVASDSNEEFLFVTGTPPTCPPIGSVGNVTVFPNPYNCSNYWYCDNGFPHIRDCPPGLEFNEKLGVCDFPWAAKCEEITETQVHDESVEVDNSVEVAEEITVVCAENGDDDVRLTNPRDCNSFYKCGDDKKPVLMKCPSGLEFNSARLVCDFPWLALCTVNQ